MARVLYPVTVPSAIKWETISILYSCSYYTSRRIVSSHDKSRNFTNDSLIEDILSEASERQRRKCNKLIFTIKKQQTGLYRDDRMAVQQVIHILSSSTNTINCPIYQLGKFSLDNSRPRPNKLTIRSEKEVMELLQKFDNSKKRKIMQMFF